MPVRYSTGVTISTFLKHEVILFHSSSACCSASDLFDDIGEGDSEYKSFMASQRVMIDYISTHPALDIRMNSAE